MPAPIADWTVADLLDFRQLLASPASADEDRRIFLDEIAPRIDAASVGDRRSVFRVWLEARRTRMPEVTIGESYDIGRRSLEWAVVAFGLILGMALAASLLAQGDAEPVNALLFLVWTVGIQWALLALAVLAWALRRAGMDIAPLRALVTLAMSAASHLLRRLPGQRRDALRAAFATLRRHGPIEGSLLKWQAFIVTQAFGVAFNVGILFAMLFVQLPFAEFRFGWQSTYEIRPAQVQFAVDTIAMPWRWAAPGAQPSIEDIAATRYARGQNAQSMPPRAARSWWPFLALTIFCYGLLLRSVMLASALAGLSRGLRALSFSDPDANALWRRLRGPLIGTEGGTALLPEPLEHPSRRAPGPVGGSCLVLLSEEVTIAEARLSAMLRERFGWAVQRIARVSIDDRSAAADALASTHPDERPPAAVVVVAPGSRDPIVAVALFLREVIAAAGAGCEVIVLLCGDAGGEGAPVDDDRYAIWQRFRAIHQLRLGIER
jgi:hypothetical protein